MPDISVILATRNRAALLEESLIHLFEQTLDPARYEICVVDNGSTDATRQVVDAVAARYPNHRLVYIYEAVPGVARARNRAIAATQSAFIAITDDDVRVPPDWLAFFLRRFDERGEKLGVVGGDIAPVWATPRPDWLDDDLERLMSAGMHWGDQPRYLDGEEYCIECNSCFRRAALAAVGNFPEKLGRIGACLLSGENVIEAQIRHQGWLALFDPGIVVRHIIHAPRLTKQWFRHRYFWQGITNYAARDYRHRAGINVGRESFIDLPLKPADWAFADRPDAAATGADLRRFEGLGFVLAVAGIISVNDDM